MPFLCGAAFIAGFFDSIVGGGGTDPVAGGATFLAGVADSYSLWHQQDCRHLRQRCGHVAVLAAGKASLGFTPPNHRGSVWGCLFRGLDGTGFFPF